MTMQNVKIVSWNVNGIRAVAKKDFIPWLRSSNADIICLQETKAEPTDVPKELSSEKQYTQYWNSAAKKGYSGVGMLTKLSAREVVFGLGDERFDSEGRVIRADFDSFVLLGVYFPNGAMSAERLRFKLDFYDAFFEHIETLRREKRPVIFCGDVNTAHKEIDLSRPKENSNVSGFLPIERAWLDKITAAGWVDTFRAFDSSPNKYTWWDYKTKARERNVGWRIDYFFINSEFLGNVSEAFILPEVLGSDHCPIGITLKV